VWGRENRLCMEGVMLSVIFPMIPAPKDIGEGIVFENTIGRALLVEIKPALGMPSNCSMGLSRSVVGVQKRYRNGRGCTAGAQGT
jgi:hypothetical protein